MFFFAHTNGREKNIIIIKIVNKKERWMEFIFYSRALIKKNTNIHGLWQRRLIILFELKIM
jgi:hypothetical protein